jgi:hypothetical protein
MRTSDLQLRFGRESTELNSLNPTQSMLFRNRLKLLLCSIAVTALLLQGCGVTGPTVKRKKVKKMDKVGVVSISVNAAIEGANEIYTTPKDLIYAALFLPPKEEVKSRIKSEIEKIIEGAETWGDLFVEMSSTAAKEQGRIPDSLSGKQKEFEQLLKKRIDTELDTTEQNADLIADELVDIFYNTFDEVFVDIDTEGTSVGNYPDLRASVQTTHSWLFEDFPKRGPFSLVEEQKILENSTYQAFRPTEGALAGLAEANRNVSNIAPGSYNVINNLRTMSSDKVTELMSALPDGTDGMMVLNVGYRITNIQVVGKSTKEQIADRRNDNPRTARARATPETGEDVKGRMRAMLSMTVVDDKGNTVLRAQEAAKSDSSFTYVHGEGRFEEDADQAVLQATRKAIGKLEQVY